MLFFNGDVRAKYLQIELKRDNFAAFAPALAAWIKSEVGSNLNAEASENNATVSNLNIETKNSVREVGQSREARGFGVVSPWRKDELGSFAQSSKILDVYAFTPAAEPLKWKIFLVGDSEKS